MYSRCSDGRRFFAVCLIACAAVFAFFACTPLLAGNAAVQAHDEGGVQAAAAIAAPGNGTHHDGCRAVPDPLSGERLLWILCGILLLVVMYNMAISVYLKSLSNLYFSLTILGFALGLLALASEEVRFVWPGEYFWERRALTFFTCMAVASFNLLTRSFLKTRKISLALDWSLLANALLLFIPMFLSLAFDPVTAAFLLLTLLPVSLILTVYAGFASMPVRKKDALFYLASLTMVIIVLVLQVAIRCGSVQASFVRTWYGIMGALYMVIVYSLGMEYRLFVLRRDVVRSREELGALSARLDEERELVHVTMKCIAEGLIVTDTEGCVFFMNPFALEITGHSEDQVAGKDIREVMNPISMNSGKPDILGKILMSRGDADLMHDDLIILGHDNTPCSISCRCASLRDAKGVVKGIIIAFTDVTRQRKYEEEIIRTSKVGALCTVAGGIAHDFNNILTAIVGNVSLAKLRNTDNGPVAGILSDIETASFRAQDLTYRLLTFSKGGAPVKSVSNIRSLLSEVVSFHLTGSSVKVKMDIEESLWNASIDQAQMSDVIGNIVINAKQAMPEGGMLWVTAMNLCIGTEEKQCVPEGNYLRITIRDEGCGIPVESLARIFDPFFTTKPEGNGLGLASSYSIVKNHEGGIEVTSSPGEGAEFVIYLPATEEEVCKTPINDSAVIRGSGRILLMDDEYIILKSIGGLLRSLGYEVVCVRNGYEAIASYQDAMTSGMAYDLVIVDLVVPGSMGGKDAVRKLLEIDPDARVMVTSGYSNDPVVSNFQAYGFKGTIIKPFTIRVLSQAISEVLDVRPV